MANRDVNLIIRAKNEASKTLSGVTDTITLLKDAQDKLSASAGKTDGSITALTEELERLKSAALASEAIEKAAKNIDVMSNALSRLEAESAASIDNLAGLKQKASEVDAQIKKLEEVGSSLIAQQKREREAVDAAKEAIKGKRLEARKAAEEQWKLAKSQRDGTGLSIKDNSKELRAIRKTYRDLAGEIDKSEQAVLKQNEALVKGQSEFDQINTVYKQTSQSLQSLTKDSKETAQATSRITAEIERLGRVGQALMRYSSGAGVFVDPKKAAQMQKIRSDADSAKQAWKSLEEEIRRTSQAIDGNATPAQIAKLRELGAGARAAKTEYQSLSAQLHKLSGAGQSIGPMFSAPVNIGGAVSGQRQLKQATDATASSMTKLGKESERASAGMFKINRESRMAMSVFQRIRGEVLSLAAAYVGLYGAINGVGSAIASVQKVEAAQNRLGVVFDQSDSKVRSEMQWLRSEAARLGIEFGALADQYTKFAVSANAANFTIQDTRKVFLAVAEAGRVNKLSMEDMNGIFLAVTQMIQKGKISAEELRGQLAERLPSAVVDMAAAFGYGTDRLDEFYKAMAEGNLIVSSSTMLSFADALNDRYGPQLQKSLKSTTTLIGQFYNNLFNASLQFANSGFLESFNALLEKMNTWFQSRDGHDFFMSLGAAAAKLTTGIGYLVDNVDLIVMAFKAWFALKVASEITGWIDRFNKFRGSVVGAVPQFLRLRAAIRVASADVVWFTNSLVLGRVAALAMNGALTVLRAGAILVQGVFAAFGGWIGIISTAISLLVIPKVASWMGGVDEVNRTTDEHQRILDEVIGKYDQLKTATTGWADIIKSTSLAEANSNLSSMFAQFEAERDAAASSAMGVDGSSFKGAVKGSGRGSALSIDAQRIKNLGKELSEGKIKITAYVDELNKLYVAAMNNGNEGLVEFLGGLIASAEQAKKTAESTSLAAEIAKGFGSTLSIVTEGLGLTETRLSDVAEAEDEVTTSTDKAAESSVIYGEAMTKLAMGIPSLREELQKLKEITDLNTSAWTALMAAWELGDPEKMANTVSMWAKGLWEHINPFQGDSGQWEAFYAGQRGTPQGADMEAFVASVMRAAASLGVSPKDLLTVMSFETGGTFDPNKMGGAGGKYMGLIQFSPDNQARYNVTQGMSAADQVKAVEAYLRDTGVKPGDGIASIYAAILSGNANNIHASDVANGGVVGDVLTATSGEQFADHKAKAEGILAAFNGTVEATGVVLKNEEKSTEELRKQQEATDKALADMGFENDMLQLKIDKKDREATIEAGIRALREQNKNLTAEEEAKARDLLGQQYDLNAALETRKGKTEAIADAEKLISDLQALRGGLVDQGDYYKQQGNTEKVQEIQSKIANVDSQLVSAVKSAKALYAAMGGPEADAAIAKFDAMLLGLGAANDKLTMALYTAEDVQASIFDTMNSGVVDVFQSFAEAVANGEDALKAVGNAFRKFAADFLMNIAKMILQQAMFNMLQGISKSISGTLFGVGLFHSGGIVGVSEGSGSRQIAPAWFNNAARYHNGGIAGLRPNEVPAVLKAGEEVLTENDSRHSRNGGGAVQGGKSTKIVNLFDAASFLSEALKNVIGEEAILNHVRANPSAWRQAMEV